MRCCECNDSYKPIIHFINRGQVLHNHDNIMTFERKLRRS